MHSPPLEWGLGIGYLVALDVLRDRGEPDKDTLSECIRDAFKVETPIGFAIFTASAVGGFTIFHRHIVKPKMRHRLIPPAPEHLET